MNKLNKTFLMLSSLLINVNGGGRAYAYNSDAEYTRALTTIVSGKSYTIYTEVNGTKYYLTSAGTLTSDKADAEAFTLTKTSGTAYEYGFRVYSPTSGKQFSNPGTSDPASVNNNSNNSYNLYSTSSFDRNDCERQVFRMDENGNYAIRTTNGNAGTSDWSRVNGMYWTVVMNGDTPCAGYTNTASEAPNYTPDYRWRLGTSDGTPLVTSPLQLSDTKVYTIKCERGYITLNTAQTMLVSSHKDGGGTVYSDAATDDASRQFGLLNINGIYYIYSPKLNKFACYEGWNLVFQSDRGVGLSFTEDSSGTPEGSTLRIIGYQFGTTGGYSYRINNNNSGAIVLNNYHTDNEGNRLTIAEVEGASLDRTAALAVFNGPSYAYDQHKVYNVTNSRVTRWTANSTNDGLIGYTGYTNASDAQQQFAIIKFDGKPHLYNLGAKKFLAQDGSLTTTTGDMATIGVWKTGDTTYPWVFYIEENGKCFNAQDSGTDANKVVINGYNSHDAGNKTGLSEVASLDAYDEAVGIYYGDQTITYHIKMDGVEVATETRSQKYYDAAALSAQIMDYMSYTYEYDKIPVGIHDIDVTATWTGPLTLSPSFAEATWYYLKFDAFGRYLYYDATASHPVPQSLSPVPGNDAYLWAFVGNPYSMKVYNKAAGSTRTINKTGTYAIDVSENASNDVWSISRYDNYAFYLSRDGKQFNCYGGDIPTAYLGLWSTAAANRLVAISETSDDFKFVTYVLKFNNTEYAREYDFQDVGATVSELPSHIKRSYITYSFNPLTVTAEGANEIEVTTTLNNDIPLFSDYASIDTWKNLKLRGDFYLRAVSASGDMIVQNAEEKYRAADDYQWAFVGNPYQVKVYNRATGSAKTLARVGEFAYMTNDAYVWNMRENTANTYQGTYPEYAGAVTLHDAGASDDACINEQGAKLAMWHSANNYHDKGSAFLVEDVPTEMMGGEGLLTDGSQLSTNSTQDGFPTSNLLRPESDGYGTSQYIWHSKWTNPNAAGTYTYLQAHLSEARTDFYFTMLSSEWSSTYDTPDEVVIAATNTPGDESTWTEVAHLTDMIEVKGAHPTRYTSPRIHAATAYTDWRFEVRANTSGRKDSNGNPYVSLGRFQMYPPVAVVPYDPADYINLVFIGNSITYGAALGSPATQAPPVKCGEYVETATGKTVGVYNGGVSGYTTTNFLPGGGTFNNVLTNASTLGKNGGKLYFSIMLGTNDSAQEGVGNAPASVATYKANMKNIIDALIAAYPTCKIMVNYPIWYSDNTHNGATYEAAGQALLHSYYPVIDEIVSEYGSQVYAGDRNTWELFEDRTDLFTAETYSSYGPFYLHPNATGAEFLGQIWAKSLLGQIEADGVSIDPTTVPIYYREGLAEGNFGTICLPYSVSEGNLKGATFYKIASKTNSHINLEEVTSLTAGHAYLYEVADGKSALQAYGDASTAVVSPVNAATSGTGLTGSFERTAIPVGCYMLKNNTLYYVDQANYAYVGANKAYIDASAISESGMAGVKQLSFFGNDDPDAIASPRKETDEEATIYNLSGQRIDNVRARKGIYIVNGRKELY